MRKGLIAALLILFPLFTGCFGVSSYFTEIKKDVTGQLDEDFREEAEFSIGPAGLTLARWFIDSEEDPQTIELLKEISHIQVGVYTRTAGTGGRSNFELLKKIDRRMKKFGWKSIVRNCSREEIALIYVNRNVEKGLRNMFIVNLSKEELVLVQLKGDINRIFQAAVHDRSLTFNH